MNKTPMIMLLLGVAFLSACIVQNAAPATDSVAPAAPDMGLTATSFSTVTFPGCDENPDNYLLFGEEGVHQIGLKSTRITPTSSNRGIVNSAVFHVKSNDPSWTRYQIELSVSPLGPENTMSGFNEIIELRKGVFSDECVDFELQMDKSLSPLGLESNVIVKLVNAGRTVATAQGRFVVG